MSTFAEKMAAAKADGPAERTVPICLRGNLIAAIEDLERQAEEARTDKRHAGLEDAGPAVFADRIRELQAQMRDATEIFRLRALSPRRYRALRAQHPPRRTDAGEVDAGDYQLGFNRDTMLPILAMQCTVEPQLTAEQWRELLGDSEADAARLEAEGRGGDIAEGVLTYGQQMELFEAAYRLNEKEIDVPFSYAASVTNPSSGGE